MILFCKMAPKWNDEVLSGIPKCKKAVMCFMEKMRVLDKPHSGRSYSESIIYIILNNVFKEKNTHETRLCIIPEMKILWSKACRDPTLYFF